MIKKDHLWKDPNKYDSYIAHQDALPEINNARREHEKDLIAKLQYLLDNFIPSEDGFFTFPDGDTWDCQKKGEMTIPRVRNYERLKGRQEVIKAIKDAITPLDIHYRY